ncbi:hypothetical protein B6U99_00290 [Candidatus Geothermarchaeota archaeon ex4572_27]|nr:MAG: hypothetical protein B6U99_00290 [Candidatus Geothermarchaeota archaeon ex4572_27]
MQLSSVHLDSAIDYIYSYLTGRGADDVAVVGVRAVRWTLKIRRGSLASVERSDTSFVRLMVGYKRRRACTLINALGEEALKKQLQRLLSEAEKAPEDPYYAPLPSGRVSYREPRGMYDGRALDVTEAAETLKKLLGELADVGIRRVSGTLELVGIRRSVKTSGGRYGEYLKSVARLNLRCFDERGLSYPLGRASVSPRGLGLDDAPRTVRDMVAAARERVAVEPGRHDVIMAPLAAANLLGHCARLASAYYVDAGSSPFAEMLGRQVASPELTLYDNPQEDNSPAAKPFDDEAVETRKTVVIDGGSLRTYLHNSRTALRHGIESTGHAGFVVPRPHSVFVTPNRGFEELLEELRQGLLITNLWYLRFRSLRAGDFTAVTRDVVYAVSGGEVKGYAPGFRLSANVVALLRNVFGAGGVPETVSSWSTPYVSTVPHVGFRGVALASL